MIVIAYTIATTNVVAIQSFALNYLRRRVVAINFLATTCCILRRHFASQKTLIVVVTFSNSAIIIHCTLDSNLIRIHLLSFLLTKVTSAIINFQPEEWNMEIPHLSSSLSDGHWVCLPLTLTINGNYKHWCKRGISILPLILSLFLNPGALSHDWSTAIWASGIRPSGNQIGNGSLINNNQSTS